MICDGIRETPAPQIEAARKLMRSLCRAIALPPTAEDMAWAMKQMESLP